MDYKLGSLFDGSGGFPLAGTLCGIKPVWASEVEPYPIAVTRARFPQMCHLGDISKIHGGEIEPVDIITFGSPCQDLSVAGKRAGLKHEANGDDETTRSGLFMEAVRIIKEMRKATGGKYPRFALWENVPGAFSSNGGNDFRVVLEEIIKITEPAASMPPVPKGGWAYADSYVGDGWSLAYRVFDAQYWGVPQRRRRIHLVADFRGGSAGEVLFERQGLRGYFAEGGTPWQGTPADAPGSAGANDREGKGINCFTPWGSQTRRCYGVDGVAPSLCAGAETSGQNQQSFLVPTGRGDRGLDDVTEEVYSVENHPADSRVNIDDSGKVQTLTSRMGTGGGNVPMVMEPFCKSARGKFKGDAETWKDAKVANTLNTFDQGEARANEPVVMEKTNFIDVEMEVAVRKYEVDAEKLVKVLREHKGALTNKEIAEALNCPVTQVEHWFRTDRCFAVPDPEVWFNLKALLGISTTEFDQSIMIFEYKGGNYDMRNRIHTGDTSPTLTCGIGNTLHLLPSDPSCVADHPAPKIDERGTAFSLNARDYKNPQAVTYRPNYIVRRLTPTECARLQGFADRWGWVEEKKSLSEEEFRFWLEVRNTHAAINGKKVQDYTERQMLTWYNKLYTDSAEYKMWGNGIALPPALYCMQGILDALNAEGDLWLL